MRGREVYNVNRNPVRRFFRRVGEWISLLWALTKRLGMIALISWGGIKYLTQGGRRSIKEGLGAQLSIVTDSELGKQFKEGLGVIRDSMEEHRYNNSPRGKAAREEYHRIQKERLRAFKEAGVDPRIKWLKPGDPGYKEEAEFQRQLRQQYDR